jgi:hypothetical protein
MTRNSYWVLFAIGLAMVATIAIVYASYGSGEPSSIAARAERIPLAVLGDSDSHSYQDTISFPVSTPARGGRFRSITLQWTEVMAHTRSIYIDLGQWGTWGLPDLVPRAVGLLGINVRKPRKRDYRYNFAVSGATCDDFIGGWREVDNLLNTVRVDTKIWRQGVVVIRIGVNSFATSTNLELLARDPLAPDVVTVIDGCVLAIREAVVRIHAVQPRMRIVLVGIFDESHWTKYFDRWQSAVEISNIGKGIDRFDNALRSIASADPRIAFFDDRAWFQGYWGGRDAQGMPAYRTVDVGDMQVTNTNGDDPRNAVLADGHAGLVWNALWAKAMVDLLNAEFDAGIAPLTDTEVAAFINATILQIN